jgi:hypothetical protein
MLSYLLLMTAPIANADLSTVELSKRVRPAVVLIQSFDNDQVPLGQGSGFFVSPRGDVITNKHVIKGAHTATVRLASGALYFVEGVSAVDADSDIVKLRVKLNGRETPFVTPTNLLPQVGEDVVVVGNPLGLESTVSKGIVSAIRDIPAVGNVVQISAPISPGSSGSPVVNMKGQVVGIATFILKEGQALNFAIPSQTILGLRPESQLVKLSEMAQRFPQAVAPDLSASLPAVKASDNPCLKFFPVDSWLVDFIDQLGENPANAAAMALITQYIEMIKGLVGIDFQKDVQYITFIFSGDVESPEFLFVVKGSFDNKVSEMRLSLGVGTGTQLTSYKDIKLHENTEMGYGFPEESTLLIGSPAMLRASLDVLNRRTTVRSDALHRTLARTNGASVLWLILKTKALMEADELTKGWPEENEIMNTIRSLEYLSLFFEPAQDGFLTSILAYLPEQKRSKELYDFLGQLKQNVLNVEGANVFLCSFLLMSDIELDGNFVRWDVHLTMSTLAELWNTKFIQKRVNSQ